MDNGKVNLSIALALALIDLWANVEDNFKEPGSKIRIGGQTIPLPVLDEMERRGFVKVFAKSRSLRITDVGHSTAAELSGIFRKGLVDFIAAPEWDR